MTGLDDGAGTDRRDWGLTCAEFLELTTDYLESALSPADTTRFETHLARCEGCSIVLDQLRQQILVAGELHEDDIAPESLARLLGAFADWQRSKNS